LYTLAVIFKGLHLLLIFDPEQNEFHFHIEPALAVYLITRSSIRKLLKIFLEVRSCRFRAVHSWGPSFPQIEKGKFFKRMNQSAFLTEINHWLDQSREPFDANDSDFPLMGLNPKTQYVRRTVS